MMLSRIALLCLLVPATAWAAGSPQPSTEPVPVTAEAEGVIEPQADAALKKMSDFLAGLTSFRVDTTTVDEKFTKEGQKIQELKESTISVVRPNCLMVDRNGPAGHVVFRYDGNMFSIQADKNNLYATSNAPPNLDAAIDDARERLQIDAPGGDLIVSHPYEALIDGLQEGRYVGLEPIGGAMAHHIAVKEKEVDWQLWIQDGPQPVPLRYVITSKTLPGQPQFTIELRNWKPNAPLPMSMFKFTPPRGAKRLEFGAQPAANP